MQDILNIKVLHEQGCPMQTLSGQGLPALPKTRAHLLVCVRREEVEGWEHVQGPQLDAPGLQVPQVRPLRGHQEQHSLPDLAHAGCAPHPVHIPVCDISTHSHLRCTISLCKSSTSRSRIVQRVQPVMPSLLS